MIGTRQGLSWPQIFRFRYQDLEGGYYINSFALVKVLPFRFADTVNLYAHLGGGYQLLAIPNLGFVAGFGINQGLAYGVGLRFDWSTFTALSSVQNSDVSLAVTYDF